MSINSLSKAFSVVLFQILLILVINSDCFALNIGTSFEYIPEQSVTLRWFDNRVVFESSELLTEKDGYLYAELPVEFSLVFDSAIDQEKFEFINNLVINSSVLGPDGGTHSSTAYIDKEAVEINDTVVIYRTTFKAKLSTSDYLINECIQAAVTGGTSPAKPESHISSTLHMSYRFIDSYRNMQTTTKSYSSTITPRFSYICEKFIAEKTEPSTHDSPNSTPAQVLPYWEYECPKPAADDLSAQTFVKGTGYSHVVMESNGEEKDCVPAGSVTTEDRGKVIWKAEDGGFWKHNIP